MFVAASKNNYTPLARVALWELAREEMIMMEMEMGTHARGHLHAHVHVAHDMAEGHAGRMPVPMGMEFNSPFASMPSRPDSFSLVRSSTAVSPPLLRRLTAANLEGVSAPFVVGLLNAIMSAATDGVPLSWTAVAARFEPVIADERPPTKKERKEMMMAEHGFGAHSHSPSHVHQHHQALGSPGAGLGLNLHHQQGSFIHMGNKGGKMGGKKPMGGGMHPQLVKA
jgi:hypothetical protein